LEGGCSGNALQLASNLPLPLPQFSSPTTLCRSQDDSPLGVDAFSSSDQCMAQSARPHEAAMASCRTPDDGWGLGMSWATAAATQQPQTEAYQSSSQGLYMLPVQVG
jgi:hypothetical protein